MIEYICICLKIKRIINTNFRFLRKQENDSNEVESDPKVFVMFEFLNGVMAH